ncbi:MAG: purine-nucleoside phosphorylase [Bacteroidota bacterium]|jgi:purine-nucleoside phosphorylase|nr:purine-nucleoside phosphorylase [Bacteroidota bacterium]
MTAVRNQIQDAVTYIRGYTASTPRIGIILGTGQGGLVEEIQTEQVLDYGDIPHFPLSTVESHHGKLIFGTLGGRNVVAMQGRFHYYEGYTLGEVTFPVRVMHALGVRTLLISNAAGGMNPIFRRGDIMVIHDHINLIGDNPLIGPNDETLGPRFPDMSEAYSEELITTAEQVALEERIPLRKGVFVAVAGPNLETRAEYRFLRAIGADAVGMSTVPENIVAIHMGMRVLAFSIITDECFPDALEPVDVPAIIKAANDAEPRLRAIMQGVIARMVD